MSLLKWNIKGFTTIPDELQEIADQHKPWVIVLTETKFTDKEGDRHVLDKYVPEYKLVHSSGKGNASRECRSGSAGVTVAVHTSLTTHNSVELVNHRHHAAKAHIKQSKYNHQAELYDNMGVYLPCNNVNKR